MAKTENKTGKEKDKKNQTLKEVREAVEKEATGGSGAREIPIGSGAEKDAPVEETKTDPVTELEAQVEKLEEEKLRALADLDNYRKRMARQFEDITRSANDSLLIDLLEVMDNFERALSLAIENGSSDCKELAAFREGTVLIYQQMQRMLDSYKVREIESIGLPFDPTFHEAMMQLESDEYAEGIVAEVMIKGYMVNDRVLRHARVSVSRGPIQTSNRDSKEKNEQEN